MIEHPPGAFEADRQDERVREMRLPELSADDFSSTNARAGSRRRCRY
jgi:hypothetical protein